MENSSISDRADEETCAPEILYGSDSISFNESEISFECPFVESAQLPQIRQKTVFSKPPPQHFSSTLCLNCKSLYDPTLNTQWSCVYHREKWNSKFFPCCGQTNINSIGCVKSKHSDLPRQELQHCSNCKENGHLSKECPKDPNTRSGLNPQDELERITKLKTPKLQPKGIRCNYELEKEGFSDIEKLKEKIREGGGKGTERIRSFRSEEEEKVRLRW